MDERLFHGMTKLEKIPVLQVNNQATVKLVRNPDFHHRTKHIIRIKYFLYEHTIIYGIEYTIIYLRIINMVF